MEATKNSVPDGGLVGKSKASVVKTGMAQVSTGLCTAL